MAGCVPVSALLVTTIGIVPSVGTVTVKTGQLAV